MVAAALLSAVLAGFIAFIKASHDTDIKLAVLENRLLGTENGLAEFKRATNESIAEIAADMKTAAKELITAASAIQVTAQSQSVINQISTKTLDSLTTKVEINASALAELRGIVHSLNQNNHRG